VRHRCVALARLLARALEVAHDHRIDLRVEPLDARDRCVAQLQRADAPGSDRGREFGCRCRFKIGVARSGHRAAIDLEGRRRRNAHFAVGITNSAPLPMLAGQRCMTDFCLV
jgi:hypothetical protein